MPRTDENMWYANDAASLWTVLCNYKTAPDEFQIMGTIYQKKKLRHSMEAIDTPITPTGQIIININLTKENK